MFVCAADSQRELMRNGGLALLALFCNSSDYRIRAAASFLLQSCEPESKVLL